MRCAMRHYRTFAALALLVLAPTAALGTAFAHVETLTLSPWSRR